MAREHDFIEPEECLPLGKRLLFATVLPLAAWTVASHLWTFQVAPRVMHRISSEAGPHLGIVVGFFASMVPLMVTEPFVLVLAGTAFLVPWKTPLRAFAGGLLRIAIAVGCGIVVMAILLLSK